MINEILPREEKKVILSGSHWIKQKKKESDRSLNQFNLCQGP